MGAINKNICAIMGVPRAFAESDVSHYRVLRIFINHHSSPCFLTSSVPVRSQECELNKIDSLSRFRLTNRTIIGKLAEWKACTYERISLQERRHPQSLQGLDLFLFYFSILFNYLGVIHVFHSGWKELFFEINFWFFFKITGFLRAPSWPLC